MPDTPPANQESNLEAQSRRWLTFVVISICITGVVAIGITALLLNGDAPPEKLKYVVATILPLLATWVGTILAFYFSRENFMAATQSVTELARTVTAAEKLKSIPVRDKMRPITAITHETVEPNDEVKVKLGDLLTKYSSIERIIILDGKIIVRFLIYRAMIERYLSRIAMGEIALPTGVATKDLTLKNLFDSDPQLSQLFQKSFGFVSADATLADVKLVMEKIDKCGDVFVTQSGKSSEPLLGWVTDNTIIENLKL
jgi:hypothetical protein